MNTQRPLFHFSCPQGWCNDPNGFSFFYGMFHLYFQHNPNDTKWGPMHWGHAKSINLLDWQNLPIALFPDTDADNQGCFSGTALIENDKQILMYTGVSKKSSQLIQQQCLAYFDGKSFKKDLLNPVIKTLDVKVEFLNTDFRDPKIWKDGENYFCICVIQKKDLNGALVLFESSDLHTWQFKNIILQTFGELGGMWECPDFFTLNNKDVIFVSPQSMKDNLVNIQRGFHKGNNSVYITGFFDKEKNIFLPENRSENNFYASQIDYGIDFYAPQTTLAPDNRRIMIAWLQAWESYLTPENFSWSGMMTLPRELLLVDNQLIQRPIREYEEKLLTFPAKQKLINSNSETVLEDENFLSFDLTVQIQNFKNSKGKITFTILDDKSMFVKLIFDLLKKELSFDRKNSINSGGQINFRSVKVEQDDNIELRFICDTYSIETFINKGKKVFTNAFFLDTHKRSIKIESTCNFNIQYKIIVIK